MNFILTTVLILWIFSLIILLNSFYFNKICLYTILILQLTILLNICISLIRCILSLKILLIKIRNNLAILIMYFINLNCSALLMIRNIFICVMQVLIHHSIIISYTLNDLNFSFFIIFIHLWPTKDWLFLLLKQLHSISIPYALPLENLF